MVAPVSTRQVNPPFDDGKTAARAGRTRSLRDTYLIAPVRRTPVFPAEIIPIKKRIIYNPIVYKLGMLLFKKVSKIRAFRKKSL